MCLSHNPHGRTSAVAKYEDGRAGGTFGRANSGGKSAGGESEAMLYELPSSMVTGILAIRILSGIAQAVDMFVEAYLRVNEKACRDGRA